MSNSNLNLNLKFSSNLSFNRIATSFIMFHKFYLFVLVLIPATFLLLILVLIATTLLLVILVLMGASSLLLLVFGTSTVFFKPTAELAELTTREGWLPSFGASFGASFVASFGASFGSSGKSSFGSSSKPCG